MHAFTINLHFVLFFLLILLASTAGLIDTIAGGGSLITVPALLILGISPAFALGTSKFQSCIGEMNACFHFLRSKKVNFKMLMPAFIFVALGSSMGTFLIQTMHAKSSEQIIPGLLLCIVLYTYFSPRFQSVNKLEKISRRLFFFIFGLCIGFYNGFLGPGTGALWVFVLMFFLGFDLVKSSLHAKPLNLAGSFSSLIWFAVGHHVMYLIGLVMAIGQLIGSRVGAHLILTRGITLVRPLYLCVVSIMMIILFAKLYF